MEASRRIVVCIPAYNEEKSIAKVVVETKKFADTVIICDDGSSDMTGEIARSLGVEVIRHEKNSGKGGALETLIAAAKKFNPQVIVTIDGDDQHFPSDIPNVVDPVLQGHADIVIGVRQMVPGSMPRERIVGNRMLNGLTSAKAGKTLHDTQSGFRAYSVRAINTIDFSQRGMAVESQTLIDAARSGLRILEVPVSVRYKGIPQKRNPAAHLSEVVDYIITRTVIDSPLLYLGLPGLIAVVLGIIAGLRVISIFAMTHQIAVGTALVGVILVLVGIVALATSLILKLLSARFQSTN